MLKKRFFAFLAAAALTAVLTLGITTAFPPVFTKGQIQEGLCYETTGVCPDAVVLSVDGTGVPADLYYFMLCSECSSIDAVLQQYGGSIDWEMDMGDGLTLGDAIKNETISLLAQRVTVEKLAQQYGVTLSEDEINELAEVRAQTVEAFGSEEAYLAQIGKLGLREESYDRLLRDNCLYEDLYVLYGTEGSELCPDPALLMQYAAEQGYITADHILIKTTDDSSQPLTGEALEEKKALAADILAQLRSGDGSYEAFAALADQYSQDPGRLTNPHGYTFTTGEMVQAFEETAYAMKEGTFSDLVETPYGYHILYRLPLSEEAAEMVRESCFGELIGTTAENADVKTSPALDSVDPQRAYAAALDAQAD